MFLKNSVLPLLLLLLIQSYMPAQAIKVRACARTTDVSPVKDGNGNDRRHLSAFYLDQIHIEDFGVANPNQYARYGMAGGESWDDGMWASGCQSNNAINSCNGCNTCNEPTINGGQLGGRIIGDIENNVRVYSKNNKMIIEATNEKDVCYETPWINAHEAEGQFLIVDVGYQGTTTDHDTRTMNIKLNYILLDDGVVRNFMNKWSNFETRQTQSARTVLLTSAEDLSDIIDINVSPNPTKDVLRIYLGSSKSMLLSLEILDLSGKSIVRNEVHLASGQTIIEEDIQNLNIGSYVLALSDGEKSAVRQFIKN